MIIAPGSLSHSISQIKRAAKAGYGGLVLKSVVGEDKDGNASMKFMRRKSTFASGSMMRRETQSSIGMGT